MTSFSVIPVESKVGSHIQHLQILSATFPSENPYALYEIGLIFVRTVASGEIVLVTGAGVVLESGTL